MGTSGYAVWGATAWRPRVSRYEHALFTFGSPQTVTCLTSHWLTEARSPHHGNVCNHRRADCRRHRSDGDVKKWHEQDWRLLESDTAVHSEDFLVYRTQRLTGLSLKASPVSL